MMYENFIDFNAKQGFICDMDGVIYHGNKLLPGVPEFVNWLRREQKRFLFLTNSSERTPKELQQKLARLGLEVGECHFYTSALATAAFLKAQAPGCSVYAIGEAGLLNALYDAGLTMNDVNPEYVVIGEGKSYSLETLTHAVNLVMRGAKLVGANYDLTVPSRTASARPAGRSFPDRAGHRQAGVFLRQTKPADDAHRAEPFRLPFRGRGHHRRPDGHGRCLRH
jgi:NagD protein